MGKVGAQLYLTKRKEAGVHSERNTGMRLYENR
jgi:hypothetical protein